MEIIHVLFIGRDMEYCKALSDSIAQLSKEIIITLYEKGKEKNVTDKGFQLVLIDGIKAEFATEEVPLIFLVENKNEVIQSLEKKYFSLYKYENVKQLIRDILLVFNATTGKNVALIRDNGCKVFSVFSCYGGSGKTCISLGLAQELVRFRGKKPLYINYEEWDGSCNYLGLNSENKMNTLGNYLYYINRRREVEIKAFVQEDEYGVSYFSPALGRNQMKALKVEEFSDFINKLILTKQFAYIIVDCQASFDENTQWLLRNSFKIIYIVEKNRGVSSGGLSLRDEGVLEYLKNINHCDIADKIIKVANGNSEMDENKGCGDLMFMDMDPASFSPLNGRIKISIERGFGEGIKKLADKIEQR